MEIRRARVSDHDAVWNIIKEVTATGDTYVYSPRSSKEKMLAIWFREDRHTYVALVDNEIAGTFF